MALCSVEYPVGDGTWWMGHKGVDLRDPEAYAAKTGARVTPVEPCSICGDEHPDGTCLLG
jgi:hypothetical protein